MKLTKKGFTSIELIISFTIVSVIVVGLFDTVLNYKNKEQIESIRNSIVEYSNNLQRVVQDDLVKRKVISATVSSDNKSVTFTFANPSTYSTIFTIDSTNGVIRYGESGSQIAYPIPSFAVNASNKEADLRINDSSVVEVFGDSEAFVRISIILNHPNLDEEGFQFRITSPINYPL